MLFTTSNCGKGRQLSVVLKHIAKLITIISSNKNIPKWSGLETNLKNTRPRPRPSALGGDRDDTKTAKKSISRPRPSSLSKLK